MTSSQPRLDWRSRYDPASRSFPIRMLIGAARPQPRRRLWRGGAVLDQGAEGACVGFSWVGLVLARPKPPAERVAARRGARLAQAIYRQAQLLDDWPGEAYEGTSVLAGAKALMARGAFESYRWCFGIDDVRDALLTVGPVVIGIPWHASMYETAKHGEVVVEGEEVGGHAILLTGYHPEHPRFGKREMYRWRNSWGRSYGARGNGWISAPDLEALLARDGEACVPVGKRRLRVLTP